MQKYKHIIFDLDGTLCDSKAGINNGFKYALAEMGRDTKADYCEYIGRPLQETFALIFSDSGEIHKAISLYREYYGERGKYENELYPGVNTCLSKLSGQFQLYVLTNKTHAFAVDIVKHFGLSSFFKDVIGLNPPVNSSKKDIALEMQKNLFSQQSVLMIGDTIHDIECAHAAGWDSCFVSYGYGNRQSVLQARPTYVADSMSHVIQILGCE